MERIDPRDAARRLGRFTAGELGELCGVSRHTALEKAEWMIELGIVFDTKERRKHEGPGRPARVFEYIPPPATKPPEKKPPPEVTAVQGFKDVKPPRQKPVGKRKRIAHPEVRELVARCVELGCKWEWTNGGHIWVIPPEGEKILVSSSPSDARSLLNSRADLRRAGVPLG